MDKMIVGTAQTSLQIALHLSVGRDNSSATMRTVFFPCIFVTKMMIVGISRMSGIAMITPVLANSSSVLETVLNRDFVLRKVKNVMDHRIVLEEKMKLGVHQENVQSIISSVKMTIVFLMCGCVMGTMIVETIRMRWKVVLDERAGRINSSVLVDGAFLLIGNVMGMLIVRTLRTSRRIAKMTRLRHVRILTSSVPIIVVYQVNYRNRNIFFAFYNKEIHSYFYY